MNTSNYDPKTKDLEYDNNTTFSNAKFGELVKRVSALESGSSGSGCECVLGWQKLYEGTFTEDDTINGNISKVIRNSELGGVYDEYYFVIENVTSSIQSNLEILAINDFSNDPLGLNVAMIPFSDFEENNGIVRFLLSSSIRYAGDGVSPLSLIISSGIMNAGPAPIIGTGMFYDKVHFMLDTSAESIPILSITIFGRKKIANVVTNEFSDTEFIQAIQSAMSSALPVNPGTGNIG